MYICVDSLSHHLLNKFFISLKESENWGSKQQWKNDCPRDDGAQLADALGGAGWGKILKQCKLKSRDAKSNNNPRETQVYVADQKNKMIVVQQDEQSRGKNTICTN